MCQCAVDHSMIAGLLFSLSSCFKSELEWTFGEWSNQSIDNLDKKKFDNHRNSPKVVHCFFSIRVQEDKKLAILGGIKLDVDLGWWFWGSISLRIDPIWCLLVLPLTKYIGLIFQEYFGTMVVNESLIMTPKINATFGKLSFIFCWGLLLIAKSYIAICFVEVLGGHDHTEYAAKHNGCALLKAGNLVCAKFRFTSSIRSKSSS